MYNILVTGCGGDLGFGIGKILKKYDFNTFGCDINDFHAGQYIFNECFIVHKVSDFQYMTDIIDIISQKNINIIIPCSEVEIEYYQNNREKYDNIEIIMCNKFAFDIGNDKFQTNLFLKQNGLYHPKTYDIRNIDDGNIKFPCIIKNKLGCGSKNVFKIEDNFIFNYYKNKDEFKNYIYQEFICGKEYTSCVYKSSKKGTRIIVIERELKNGFTNKGKIIFDEKINEFLNDLAEKLNLYGSINIQFIIRDNIPYIFEINPRFSSTVVFRDILGFHDLIWSIEDEMNVSLINKLYKPIEENIRFCVQPEQYILK